MKHEVIQRLGRSILYFDYSNLKEDDFIEGLRRENIIIMNYPGNPLVLDNYEGAELTERVKGYMESEETLNTLAKISKGAVIGLSRFTRIALNCYNTMLKLAKVKHAQPIKCFETKFGNKLVVFSTKSYLI
jgi:hypothetical protein